MKKQNFITFLVFFSISVFSQSLVQTTFCRHGLFIHINQLVPTYDTIFINLPGVSSVIDINFIIDTLTHTWDSDMEMYLLHLSQSDSLVSHRGGSGDNFMHTILDDSAAMSISQGSPPFSGTYRPERPLSVFNGSNPNGPWIFKIIDNQGGDDGYIRAWCLQITYSSPTGIITVNNNIPDKFSLSQNYPNPFNPSSKIKFQIAKLSDVKLRIFDVLGREINILVNEQLSPGTYEVEFDPEKSGQAGLSSGIYYYRLITDSYVETKKMVLIK